MKIIKKLITDAGEIPLSDVDFTLSFALVDADDLSARDSFKSSTIAIPLTPAVASIFNRFQKVEFPEPENMRGVLQIENLFLRGDVIIHGTERIMDVEVINVQVVANGFFERLAGFSIRDLNFAVYEKTANNIIQGNDTDEERKFIVVDHGNLYDVGDVKVVEVHPIVWVEAIIRYTIGALGYSIGTGFNIPNLDFILDFSGLLMNEPDFMKGRKAVADFTSDVNDSFFNAGGTPVNRWITAEGLKETDVLSTQLKKLEWDNLNNDCERFTLNDSRYTADKAGAYRFRVNYSIAASRTSVTVLDNPVFELMIYKNGSIMSDFSKSYTMTTATIPEDTSISFNTSFIHLEAGDYIEIYYKIKGRVQIAPAAEFDWSNNNAFSLNIEADPRYGIGSDVDIKNHIPDWPAAQFLKNYFTLRNLVCEVNEETKRVTIMPKTSYYTSTVIDLSDRILKTEKIEVTKYNKPSKLTFEFSEDAKDITFIDGSNKAIQTFTNTREPEQSLKLDFAKTVFNPFTAIGQASYTPKILEEITDFQTHRKLKYDFKTRIIEFTGDVSVTPSGTIEGEAWEYYPEVEPITPEDFKNEYLQDIKEMQLAKVMKCSAMIKPHEINSLIVGGNFSLRNLVRVGVNVYKILKIEGWNINNNVARLTLLQNV